MSLNHIGHLAWVNERSAHSRGFIRNIVRGALFAVGLIIVLSCARSETDGNPSAVRYPSGPVSIPQTDGIGFNTNCLPREPLLYYDVSGETLVGIYHRSLCVYSDGCVSVSKEIADLDGDAQLRMLAPGAIADLRDQLFEAGAQLLHDDCQPHSDMPMTTVTFFSTSADSPNTYSYFSAEGGRAGVEQVINNFMAKYFPEF